MSIIISKLYILVALAAFAVCVSGQTDLHQRMFHDDEKRIKQLAASLDIANPLRRALEAGYRGEGIEYPWMNDMKRMGVKQASFVVTFVCDKGRLGIEISEVTYLTSYFQFDQPVTNKAVLHSIIESGLERALTERVETIAKLQIPVLLVRARDSSAKISSIPERFCGTLYFNLIDDPILPSLDEMPDLKPDCI